MKLSARKAIAAMFAGAALAATLGTALANAPPPTNGGNGGGQSGQCTGNPNDRPASCGP
jgi:hypothetical protein